MWAFAGPWRTTRIPCLKVNKIAWPAGNKREKGVGEGECRFSTRFSGIRVILYPYANK